MRTVRQLLETGVVERRYLRATGDERRFDTPVVMICPEYDIEQARSWLDGSDVPELADANRVSYLDLDSGHWPLFSCPTELAGLIDAAVETLGGESAGSWMTDPCTRPNGNTPPRRWGGVSTRGWRKQST